MRAANWLVSMIKRTFSDGSAGAPDAVDETSGNKNIAKKRHTSGKNEGKMTDSQGKKNENHLESLLEGFGLPMEEQQGGVNDEPAEPEEAPEGSLTFSRVMVDTSVKLVSERPAEVSGLAGTAEPTGDMNDFDRRRRRRRRRPDEEGAEPGDVIEGKEPREPREPRAAREPREPRQPRPVSEPREAREPRPRRDRRRDEDEEEGERAERIDRDAFDEPEAGPEEPFVLEDLSSLQFPAWDDLIGGLYRPQNDHR